MQYLELTLPVSSVRSKTHNPTDLSLPQIQFACPIKKRFLPRDNVTFRRVTSPVSGFRAGGAILNLSHL